MRRVLFLLMAFAMVGARAAHGQQPSDQPANETAIRAMAAAYAEAFNSHDPQKVAEHWSPDAVYLNRDTGEEVVGRTAIAEQFAVLFEERPDVKMEVTVTSIEFVSPNVAIEQGTTKLLSSSGEPEEMEYSAVDVRQDGKWLLDRVTDKSHQSATSHYEQLKSLEWMVGSWTNETPDAEVEIECHWTKNKNYLTRAFKIAAQDLDEISGVQIIGWDPAAKTIRSWTFDSNGAYAEGAWELKEGRWFIRNRGVLPDGQSATMINVMRQVDENSLTWQTIERTAGEELLPNIDEIQIVRR